jgi:hypothetical protein
MDFSKILAKFGFMMDSYKDELEIDYCVSILDNDSTSKMKTKGVATCASKFPYLFVNYKQEFLSLQGEQGMARFVMSHIESERLEPGLYE